MVAVTTCNAKIAKHIFVGIVSATSAIQKIVMIILQIAAEASLMLNQYDLII